MNMIIKKIFIFTLALYCTKLYCSSMAPSQEHKSKDTFIVIFTNSEAVLSRGYGENGEVEYGITRSVATPWQQAHIYCPGNPAALSCIKNILAKKDHIELNHLIAPIFPIIAKHVQQGKINKPNLGFIVSPNQSVVSAVFEPELFNAGVKVMNLENNPIPPEWFKKESPEDQ